ncbi:hypothetical protein BWQ96_07529 [Gracilariopsis chorda]|uniref:Uncharacterized protein n=1 Tax=Gracilariopsis chorda TaxID=448386 RepID=A0A2V3IKU6_9FLOR|nr:hypothetical protein BWQ96_07529 [Gracilariopsis chorda]|eukprot:PXF42714.1 hypothetical protein BWQ96_07529 [Gracilariopsis chorda]
MNSVATQLRIHTVIRKPTDCTELRSKTLVALHAIERHLSPAATPTAASTVTTVCSAYFSLAAMSAHQPCSEHESPALSSTEGSSLHSARSSDNAKHTLGRRHGMFCSFHNYCEHLFEEDGGYDLVDGVLVSLKMADPTHNDIVSSLASIISDQYADRKHSYWPFYESRIHIPSRGLFAWIRRITGNETVRRADLVIADVSFSSARRSRSNRTGSDTLRFPLNKSEVQRPQGGILGT